jgi:hypothetical protein
MDLRTFLLRTWFLFEMMSMDTIAFLGIFAIIGGLVFYFTSGAFSILSASLGTAFQIIGIVLIYMGIAFLMWNILSSLNIFLERFVRRS